MEDRFFFDGIYILAYQLAIYQAVKNPILIFPYLAYPPLVIFYVTVVSTEKTLDTLFFFINDPLKVSSLHDTTSYTKYMVYGAKFAASVKILQGRTALLHKPPICEIVTGSVFYEADTIS